MPILTNRIGDATKAITAGGKEALRRAAESHVSVAKQLAPVDTGFMRDHIKVVEDNRGLSVVSEAPYSIYVEFGTVNSDAQPFFLPAFGSALRQLKKEAPELIKESLAKNVSQAKAEFRGF